jgi:xylulokinase
VVYRKICDGLGKGKDQRYKRSLPKRKMPPTGSQGLFFLPYLSGERTPHADPLARGCFIADHTAAAT